ncbi:MAG TPA: MFS transporter [Gaiellaceae bacterium]|nr:MFS transporter [Gaiellaceae bacterium]
MLQRNLLVLVSLGAYAAVVDAPIISVATPEIARSFPGVGLETMAWVLDAYFVAFAAGLLTSGRLADHFGRPRFLLGGLLLFVLASIACAVTPSIGVLIAARALQAIGGATVIPAGQAILLAAYPPAERYKAIIALGTVVALGSVTAPTIGGVLLEIASWQWIFWLSAAIGFGAFVFGLRVVPRQPGDRTAPVPDPLGTVAQTLSAALIVFAILGVQRWGADDVRVWGCAVIAVIALTLAIVRSRGSEAASMNLELFQSRTLAWANAGSFLAGLALFGGSFACVLFFSSAWGWSPLEIGLAFIPGSITSAIAGRRGPQLAGRFGPARLTLGCTLIGAAGCAWWAIGASETQNYWLGFVPGQLLYGFGIAGGLTALVALSVVSAPPDDFGSASGINGALRQVGGAIGVAVVAAAFASQSLSLVERARIGWAMAVLALLAAALCAWRLQLAMASPPAMQPSAPAAAEAETAVSA